MSLVDEARAVRERIAARLRELEPLVLEYQELQQLAAEMGLGESDSSSRAAESGSEPAHPSRPAPSRRRAAKRGPETGRSPQRNDETRLAQRVLDAVRAEPGKTVAEYAAILGVAPTALYRPVRRLANEGALVNRARQLFPDGA
jgi:hypothetical protein